MRFILCGLTALLLAGSAIAQTTRFTDPAGHTTGYAVQRGNQVILQDPQFHTRAIETRQANGTVVTQTPGGATLGRAIPGR